MYYINHLVKGCCPGNSLIHNVWHQFFLIEKHFLSSRDEVETHQAYFYFEKWTVNFPHVIFYIFLHLWPFLCHSFCCRGRNSLIPTKANFLCVFFPPFCFIVFFSKVIHVNWIQNSSGDTLAVQRLRFGTFIPVFWVEFLVRYIRPHKPYNTVREKKSS